MNEQKAARPVWRWKVVGDEVEVDVESDGARFSAGAATAGAAVAVVGPEISLCRECQINETHRQQELLTTKYMYPLNSYLFISLRFKQRGRAKRT